MKKSLRVLIGCCYAVLILYITLFSRTSGSERIFHGMFWELRGRMWHDIILNILLFFPLGFLFASWKGLLFGVVLSVFIEIIQFAFALGYCELDDMLNNSIGVIIGSFIGYSLMGFKKWEDLPSFMKIDEVRPYYEILKNKRISLFFKRLFDLAVGIIVLVILAIPMLIIAIMIKVDSEGPIFYRQERVTTYGKHFKIHKFRTMVCNADKIGTAVTVENDSRITKAGARLRGHRLDELPQIFDVLSGNMSFVGTRPEAVKYVEKYKPEYMATLLLPAGITSEASIRYKDEAELLDAADDVDRVYIETVLPGKMKYNLQSLKKFSFFGDIATMFRTVFAVLGKDYN